MEKRNIQINDDLLVRFLLEDVNEEETAQVNHWINKNSDNRSHFERMRSAWMLANTPKNSKLFDSNKAWDIFETRFLGKSQIHNRYTFRSVSLTLLRYAAVVIISYMLFTVTNKEPEIKPVVYQPVGNQEFLVPYGSKSKITLPDGTKVWINSGSKISYKSDFNKTRREIALEGEAFFDVTENKAKPFIVRTKEINVHVYGTTFNVKAYPSDSVVQTTLVKGKVSIFKENNKKENVKIIDLKPNQSFTLQTKHQLKYVSPIAKCDSVSVVTKPISKPSIVVEKNPEKIVSWKDNKLVFDNERFEDIITRIERWFDVKIHVTDASIKDFRYTGSFKNKETINQVMEVIKLTSSLTYSIKDNDIFISTRK